MRRRIAPPAVVLAAGLMAGSALLAGCGVTDAEVRPGVAVEVDGRTLSLSKVDDVVRDYCALRATNPQAPAAPTVAVRGDFARAWAQAEAVTALAREYGVAVPSSAVSRAEVEAAWQQLGPVTDANLESLTWLTRIQQVLDAPLVALGDKLAPPPAGDETPDPQAAQAAAVEAVEMWLKDNDLTLNPVFGVIDEKTGASRGDDLSIAVSSEARAKDDVAQLAQKPATDLPEGERCGAGEPAPAG